MIIMKKYLAILLAAIMLIPSFTVNAQGINLSDYTDGGILWQSDFEIFDHGEEPSALQNSNAVTPSEWISAPNGMGGCVIEDEETGNKYYRFYNSSSSNVTATFSQTFNMTTQELDAFKIEFDIMSKGVAFNTRWKSSSLTTYFLNIPLLLGNP